MSESNAKLSKAEAMGSPASVSGDGGGPKGPTQTMFGLAGGLYAAFGALAGGIVLASTVAWLVFTEIDRSVGRVTDESVPGMVIALALAEQSAEIAATAPSINVSGTQADRVREQAMLEDRRRRLESLIDQLAALEVSPERIASLSEFVDNLGAKLTELNSAVEARLGSAPDDALVPIEIPFTTRQNGRVRPIVLHTGNDAPRGDPKLIAMVADARRWITELVDGEYASVAEITGREGLRKGAVSRILPLAWLAPDIAVAILDGRQPIELTAKRLRDLQDLPLDWKEQRRLLGLLPA